MSYKHLTPKERVFIALMLNQRCSIREIASELDRAPSTISRELRRNKKSRNRYGAKAAQDRYECRMRWQRTGKHTDLPLRQYVLDKLQLLWSPEQIAGRIRLDFPHDPSMRISHTTIYRWLYKEQIPRAKQARKGRRHYGHKHGDGRGKLRNVKEVRRRERLGDWEADTMVGTHSFSSPSLLSLCERKSRACGLVLLHRNRAAEVLQALENFFSDPAHILKTITSDRGKEFYCFKDVEERLQVPFYFARPHSPWQKGSVENLNGLIRQYFPTGVWGQWRVMFSPSSVIR